MDDDKTNLNENQSKRQEEEKNDKGPTPIFQAVPEEHSNPLPESLDQKEEEHYNPLPEGPELQPEEISPELTAPPNLQPPDEPPPPDSSEPSSFEQNRSKYLIIGAAAVFFVFILILILRLVFGGGKKEVISLTYWGLWDDAEVMQPLIDQYQKSHENVKIQYQKMTPDDYKDKLLARSKNSQGPDIFRFHNTWVPEIKEVLTAMPESVMSNGEYERTFYKIHQKDLKVDERYYGIPLMVDGLVLVYNENLFKKAGITNAPTSWEDIFDYVGKLTVKTKDNQIVTSGIALGTTNNIEHFSDVFGLFLAQNGGNIKNLDSGEAVGALQSYRKFAEPPDSFWDENMPNSTSAFVQEKVAMIIVPSWEILTIQKANPDLALKTVPVPLLPGSKPVSIATYWVEGVSKFSTHQTESWEFLRFLSERDQMAKLYELQAKTRRFGAPYSRVDLASTLSQNEYIGAVIKQAEADSYVSMPVIARTYDNGLNDDIIKYIENAINAASQGVSYQEAMSTAKQGVDQVFSRYQIE